MIEESRELENPQEYLALTLDLSQDESIRNAISDGNNICISILDERDTESFTTKKTIIVDFNELKEKAYQTK